MIIELMAIIFAMTVSDLLATLKTIFLAKKILRPVYVVVFINALIFVLVVSKIVSNEEGLYYALAFATGKALGVFVGGQIEKRMAIGIYEIDVFFNNKEKVIDVADRLREKGYSVNTHDAYGIHGRKRYIVGVTIKRKWLKQFKNVLREMTGKEPTMVIREVNDVHGKIRNTL